MLMWLFQLKVITYSKNKTFLSHSPVRTVLISFSVLALERGCGVQCRWVDVSGGERLAAWGCVLSYHWTLVLYRWLLVLWEPLTQRRLDFEACPAFLKLRKTITMLHRLIFTVFTCGSASVAYFTILCGRCQLSLISRWGLQVIRVYAVSTLSIWQNQEAKQFFQLRCTPPFSRRVVLRTASHPASSPRP